MKQQLISEIFDIIQDYHCDTPFIMSKDRIEEWIDQFDEADREFLLSEFLHLLKKGIYISKEKGKEILWSNLIEIAKREGYTDIRTFIWETRFILLQKAGKSQDILYQLLQEVSSSKAGCKLNEDMHIPVKNYIYLDDVLATGKTIYEDLKIWLSQEDNLNKVVQSEVNLYVSLFACHMRGFQNNNWRLKLDFDKDELLKKIKLQVGYEIDDRVRFPSSKLNFTIPIKSLSEKIDKYFEILEASSKGNEAYREENKPIREVFFSSPQNRNKFELIIASKGIDILDKVKSLNPAHRPFGATFPSYKTFGTGTLFFTWRNISNTCPLVFWWDHVAHEWKSLFPLQNRG